MIEKPTRDGYGQGLIEAGRANPKVVVLCADLTESTRSLGFKKEFPDRFVQIGVSEQSMAVIAAGMALAGKIPFISSYAVFSPGRNWEQIRTNIALNDVNVKIAGAHAGVSVGPDGATHQALEDLATMRVLSNMVVLYPCDMHEARKATLAAAQFQGPVYLRFAREKSPIFTTPEMPFKIGRAEILFDSGRRGRPDVALVACGPLLYEALLAAEILRQKKITARVINNHTVKPMDEKTILTAAHDCGAIVTVEEHQVQGGMGSRVAEILAAHKPTPMEFVGMPDRYGESGEPRELLEAFHLTAPWIVKAAVKVIKRKYV
ncbi:MAG: 1-deoxy-D-xylulose-5-phosphate synthase, transketolase [Candidatus Magasanikbacteria bacterium]|nr:1-deoxy-D-xylulose-5-phosphate synthase, transketolase [Candidatus Magasanikbacteria bacterium]